MDPNPLLQILPIALRRWKQKVVDSEGIGADLPESVIALDRTYPVGAQVLVGMERHQWVATVCATVALTDCTHAVCIAECWETDEEGDLDPALRFAAGDPGVSEAVTALVMARDRRYTALKMTYHYHGKRVVWSEPERDRVAEMDGLRLKALSEGFRLQSERPGPAVLHGPNQLQMTDAGEAGDLLYYSFAVALPCTCGSGRPIEQCCASNN